MPDKIVEVSYKRASRSPKSARRATKGKKKSLSKYKKELDAIFSKYIRAKYKKECYTCGVTGKALQCGHFVSRLYLATRWDESNCRPQCVGCNIWGAGKPLDFEERLKEELGVDVVEEMKARRKQLLNPTRTFYEEQIDLYTAKLKDLW